MHCPSTHHFSEVEEVIQYVCGKISYGISYKKFSNFRLIGYKERE